MELLRALATLSERPDLEHGRIARALELPGSLDPAAYTDLFTLQLYPYAAVYLGAEGMLGGEACDRVAGFWRALGVVPPAEPDHLATLLALYAGLRERAETEENGKRHAALEHASAALLWEHLLPWVPLYARKVRAISRCEGYRAWARMLEETLATETDRDFGTTGLPLHLREAPELTDPRVEGVDAFITALLAPARSGYILVRDDFRRASRELGLGLRHGERRFVLKALLAQDHAATLDWLAAEARAAALSYRSKASLPPAIAVFWIERAAATAEMLTELAATSATEMFSRVSV
jgi:TorA maturation chaperone TorD